MLNLYIKLKCIVLCTLGSLCFEMTVLPFVVVEASVYQFIAIDTCNKVQ